MAPHSTGRGNTACSQLKPSLMLSVQHGNLLTSKPPPQLPKPPYALSNVSPHTDTLIVLRCRRRSGRARLPPPPVGRAPLGPSHTLAAQPGSRCSLCNVGCASPQPLPAAPACTGRLVHVQRAGR